MPSIVRKVKGLLSREKEEVSTPQSKLNKLQNESESVVNVFSSMVNNLRRTNDNLLNLANEANVIADTHRLIAEGAIEKANSNNKIIEKIANIIQ